MMKLKIQKFFRDRTNVIVLMIVIVVAGVSAYLSTIGQGNKIPEGQTTQKLNNGSVLSGSGVKATQNDTPSIKYAASDEEILAKNKNIILEGDKEALIDTDIWQSITSKEAEENIEITTENTEKGILYKIKNNNIFAIPELVFSDYVKSKASPTDKNYSSKAHMETLQYIPAKSTLYCFANTGTSDNISENLSYEVKSIGNNGAYQPIGHNTNTIVSSAKIIDMPKIYSKKIGLTFKNIDNVPSDTIIQFSCFCYDDNFNLIDIIETKAKMNQIKDNMEEEEDGVLRYSLSTFASTDTKHCIILYRSFSDSVEE